MPRHVKTSMHEGQDKFARLLRIDQLLRTPQGCTIEELMTDPQMDDVSDRTLKANLKELQDKYGAVYEEGLKRGRERVWRYKACQLDYHRLVPAAGLF